MSNNTTTLDATFWDTCWKQQFTHWDLKSVSPPLKTFIDSIADKTASILIPGCGNAYEAEYLLANGFKNITIIDIAPSLVAQLLQKFEKHIGKELTLIAGDFFGHKGKYDIILEQTFFCALDPKLRSQYVAQMHRLLNKNGVLSGLLFNRKFNGGPPFGGSKEEYLTLFSAHFTIKNMDICTNSVQPRLGSELFFEVTPL